MKYLTYFLATALLVVLYWSFVHTRTDAYSRVVPAQDDVGAGTRDIRDVQARKFREAMLRAAAAIERGNIAEANQIVDQAKISRDAIANLIDKAAGVSVTVSEPPISLVPSTSVEAPPQPEPPKSGVEQIGTNRWLVSLVKSSDWFDSQIEVGCNDNIAICISGTGDCWNTGNTTNEQYRSQYYIRIGQKQIWSQENLSRSYAINLYSGMDKSRLRDSIYSGTIEFKLATAALANSVPLTVDKKHYPQWGYCPPTNNNGMVSHVSPSVPEPSSQQGAPKTADDVFDRHFGKSSSSEDRPVLQRRN